MVYLLDANVFISAKNLHYGLDFCPAFWDWLITHNARGTVFSIEKVATELLAGDDELSSWTKDHEEGFFLAPTEKMFASLNVISEWVLGRDYTEAAINTFFQVADYYLVGYAHAYNYTVVTHEVSTGSKNKIKIPEVCTGLSVPCVLPFEMLRRERARFVLDRQTQP